MTEAFWWYLLAGFIVGFSVSTLWEWLYFRRRRMAIRDRRVAELEATVRTYAAAAPAPGASRAEDDWGEPGFQNPLVYLETEDLASSATAASDYASGAGPRPAPGYVAGAKNGVTAAQPVSHPPPVTLSVAPAGAAAPGATPTGAIAFQSLSVQPAPGPAASAQTGSQGEAAPAAVAALGAVALAGVAMANPSEEHAPVAVAAVPGAASVEEVEPDADAFALGSPATDAPGVNAGVTARTAATATAARGAPSAEAPSAEAPSAEAPSAPQAAPELIVGQSSSGGALDEAGATARVTGLRGVSPVSGEAPPAAVVVGSSAAAAESSESEVASGAFPAAATPISPTAASAARIAASSEVTPQVAATPPAADSASADAQRDAPAGVAPVAAAAVGAALLANAAEDERTQPAADSRQAPALTADESAVTAAPSDSAKPITSNDLDALRLSIHELIENVSHDEAPAVAAVGLTTEAQADSETTPTDVYTTQVSGRTEYVLVRLVQSFVQFVRQVRAIMTGADAARPAVHAPQASTPQDDLTRITGLTPADAERLQMAGVTTYARLARLSAEELRLITLTPDRAVSSASAYTQWPVEAAALAATPAHPSRL